jgi:short-chain fatty acids transporter
MTREMQPVIREQPLVRFGLALANWSERCFPDPLVFALIGIVVVFVVGILLLQSPAKLAVQGGRNFWALVPLTMQMVVIIVGGYVVASTPMGYRAIRAFAGIPKTPRRAVALVVLFSMMSSLISWGMSLAFSGLFVRELAHRVKGMDYPAAGAAAYFGMGAVWAMGLSSSAAMLMATKSSMPLSLFNISGLIPLTQTLFLRQSIATTVILIVLSVLRWHCKMSNNNRGNLGNSQWGGANSKTLRSRTIAFAFHEGDGFPFSSELERNQIDSLPLCGSEALEMNLSSTCCSR